MKFFSLLSVLFLTFIATSSVQACVVNLQCGQELQIEWSSQGSVGNCQVTSPNRPIRSGVCDSPWIDVEAESGTYTFSAQNTATGAYLESTCQINMPTNCGGGDFTISASPNPVQVCAPATQGTTNISWSIPSGKTGGIRASSQPGWFVPSGTSISSSQPAPWITTAQSPHTFTLFETTGGIETPRATVSVSTTNVGCSGTGPQCGNGTVEGSEQCDAGMANGNGTSGCSAQCTLTSIGGTGFCGDSQVQNPNASGQTEQCDLGSQNGQVGSACSATCQNAGSGIAFKKCDSSNQCADAGEHASYAACVAANGGAPCYGSCEAAVASCNFPPPDQTFYKCGTTGCETAGNYPSITECNAAHGTCYYYSNCNNECSATYTLTATIPNICPGNSGETTIAWTAPANTRVQVEKENQIILFNQLAPGNTVQTISGPTTFHIRPVGYQTPIVRSVTVTPTQNSCQPNGGINIGWDTSYQTKNKTVNIPPSVNETLYVNTDGEKGCTISGGLSINPVSYSAYAVNNVPAGSYTYTLSCPGIAQSVSATLTVNSAASGFNCSNNSCQLCGGATGILCDGTGSGCTGDGQRCTVPPLETRWRCSGSVGTPCTQITCQGAACDGTYASKSACEDATQCSTTPPPPTLGAECVSVTVSPSRIVSGRSVSVVPTFRNIGSTAWGSGTFSARITGATNGWPSSTTVFVTSLVAGAPTYGTFSPVFTFTAPSVSSQTLYPFSVSMFNGTTAFDDSCSVIVNGGPIIVYPPQCSDGRDNDDPEDALNPLADNADPACIRNGIYDPNWDDERDPSPDAVLRISANPQLVRQSGRSVVTYEVNRCTVADGEGNLVDGPWAIAVNGTPVSGRSGVGNSGGVQTIDVSNIQTRLVYTLSCGGTSRSATISVIKINEF